MTCIEGIAGGTIPTLPSGVRPTDGHNLWPALLGENLTSPRTEVIHAVHNQYVVPSWQSSASSRPTRKARTCVCVDWQVL